MRTIDAIKIAEEETRKILISSGWVDGDSVSVYDPGKIYFFQYQISKNPGKVNPNVRRLYLNWGVSQVSVADYADDKQARRDVDIFIQIYTTSTTLNNKIRDVIGEIEDQANAYGYDLEFANLMGWDDDTQLHQISLSLTRIISEDDL